MATSDHNAILRANPESEILFIRRADARRLHAAGKLQKIEGKAEYCAPRNWRMIAHNKWGSLPLEALQLSALRPIDLRTIKDTSK